MIIQQEKTNIVTIIVSCISTALITFICFIALGSFYSAINHRVGLNIFVWIITISISYFIYYGLHWLAKLINKKICAPKLLNVWAVLSGLVIVTIVCLFRSENIDDYLYVEIMGLISGIIAFFQIIYSLKKK